jgi:hypothetical protein
MSSWVISSHFAAINGPKQKGSELSTPQSNRAIHPFLSFFKKCRQRRHHAIPSQAQKTKSSHKHATPEAAHPSSAAAAAFGCLAGLCRHLRLFFDQHVLQQPLSVLVERLAHLAVFCERRGRVEAWRHCTKRMRDG